MGSATPAGRARPDQCTEDSVMEDTAATLDRCLLSPLPSSSSVSFTCHPVRVSRCMWIMLGNWHSLCSCSGRKMQGRGVVVLSPVYKFLCCHRDSQSRRLRGGVKHTQGDCRIGSAQTLSSPSLGFPGGLRPHPSSVWDENSLVPPPVASSIFSASSLTNLVFSVR